MGAKLNSKVVWDKADGVKNNLDSAFCNAYATNADLVSDSPGKEPPLGRGGRGKGARNNIAAELKKKQKQEENELKRKKKQEETELKKKKKQEESELRKKKAAELKKKKQQEEAELNKEKQQEEADLKKAIPISKNSRSGTIRIPIPTKKKTELC
ncbi:ULP_PROTEASE domain-containing protein [Raphanus sativus]|nr:ULP_PROTEASE domain-containing protein [Raphanus sativus]